MKTLDRKDVEFLNESALAIIEKLSLMLDNYYKKFSDEDSSKRFKRDIADLIATIDGALLQTVYRKYPDLDRIGK